MPYIITTKTPTPGENLTFQDIAAHRRNWSRRAVGTLDEAHELAQNVVENSPAFTSPDHYTREGFPLSRAAEDLPESGGTIGPLPDGTVIEVECVPVERLIFQAGIKARYVTASRFADTAMSDADVIDAYNAAQED